MARTDSASLTIARLGSRLGGAHPFERGERLETGDAVGLVPHVPLELAERAIGAWAEETVFLARVEAQHVQLALEGAHIVAAVIGESAGRGSDRPAGSRPRRADPRCRDRPARRPSGCARTGTCGPRPRWRVRTCRRARGSPRVRRARPGAAGCREPRGPGHRGGRYARGPVWAAPPRAATAPVDRVVAQPARCGSTSRRIASFGLAPTTRATSLPPLNRINEGMLITP